MLQLVAHLSNTSIDCSLVACTVNDNGCVLGNLNGLSGTKSVNGNVCKRHAEVLGNYLAARNNCDVLEDASTTIAEAGSLDGNYVQGATQLVQQQGAQCFALNVFCNDEQRTACLHDAFQQGNHILDGGNLKVGEQDVRIVQNGFHALGVGCHVRRNVTAIVLHALNNIDVDAESLAVLNGNSAVFANFVHCLSDLFADYRIASRNGTNVCDLLLGGDFGCIVLDSSNNGFSCLIDTAANAKSVSTSGYVAQALAYDNVGKEGCGSGAVTSNVVGLNSGFLYQLSAHVFHGILELNFASNSNAVVGYQRCAERALESNVATLRSKGYLYGVCELLYTLSHACAGIGLKLNFLSHIEIPFK